MLCDECSGSILEIGPGLGILTLEYLKEKRNVYAVEIDPVLVDTLKSEFSDNPNLHIFHQDARDFIHTLKTQQNIREEYKIRCVGGNLPYYITSELLTEIVLIPDLLKGVFLVQKEYAMRCVSERSESSLNVYLNNFGKWKIAMNVGPSAFFPAPSVNSSVIIFEPMKRPYCDALILQNILRMSFRGRRKKIKNAWSVSEGTYSSLKLEAAAEEAGISIQKRPEELTREEYYRLTEGLKKIIDME
jgi:16S rRNA (adenine1518-N6/adenine1519-N6)-dimethyltransferase